MTAADIRVVTAGAPLERAKAAVVLLHGRGDTAEDIVGLAEALAVADQRRRDRAGAEAAGGGGGVG